MFNNLRELISSMPDENTCRQYLAKQRWNGNTVCPYCGHSKCYTIEGGKRYKCADKTCFKRFTVTVGTIFEASNVPLNKWFTAIYLCTAHKRGISSYQLAKDIGVTQKTGWFMLHRIREVLRPKNVKVLGLNAPVEADETFVGGKYANMHNKKRIPLLESGDYFANKTTVLGMIERGGELIANVVPPRNTKELTRNIITHVQKNATLITDSTSVYNNITHSYNYHAVNHSISEYVNGDNHTNTIEGAFSHFKRSIYGTFFQISAKHTQRYCDEFAAKYNSRKIKDADRFVMTIQNAECRLKYKTLVAALPPSVITVNSVTENRNYGIIQLKDGEVIGHYNSIKEAHKKTGLDRHSIRKALKGIYKKTGGFNWIYA